MTINVVNEDLIVVDGVECVSSKHSTYCEDCVFYTEHSDPPHEVCLAAICYANARADKQNVIFIQKESI